MRNMTLKNYIIFFLLGLTLGSCNTDDKHVLKYVTKEYRITTDYNTGASEIKTDTVLSFDYDENYNIKSIKYMGSKIDCNSYKDKVANNGNVQIGDFCINNGRINKFYESDFVYSDGSISKIGYNHELDMFGRGLFNNHNTEKYKNKLPFEFSLLILDLLSGNEDIALFDSCVVKPSIYLPKTITYSRMEHGRIELRDDYTFIWMFNKEGYPITVNAPEKYTFHWNGDDDFNTIDKEQSKLKVNKVDIKYKNGKKSTTSSVIFEYKGNNILGFTNKYNGGDQKLTFDDSFLYVDADKYKASYDEKGLLKMVIYEEESDYGVNFEYTENSFLKEYYIGQDYSVCIKNDGEKVSSVEFVTFGLEEGSGIKYVYSYGNAKNPLPFDVVHLFTPVKEYFNSYIFSGKLGQVSSLLPISYKKGKKKVDIKWENIEINNCTYPITMETPELRVTFDWE